MGGWLQRVRGSVRLRVTLLAAGAFAVTLLLAATVLLRALENVLVDDVRAADRAALEIQAAALLTRGLPDRAEIMRTRTASAAQLPLTGVSPVVVVFSDPTALDRIEAGGAFPVAGPTGDVVFDATAVPQAGARLLGIEDQPDRFTTAALDIGGGVLVTASPLDDVRSTLDATRRLMFVLGPALVGLVAGLAWVLVGRALRPVHAVTSRVAAIGSRSLHERVPVPPGGDEVAELATTMNGMLQRLETASTTNRRLVSDASHELRTPVTVIRTELEVARRSAHPDWDAVSDVALGELDRLQVLVDDLLLLARSDEQRLAVAPVSVVDVAHDVAARRRALPVDVDVPGERNGDGGARDDPPPAVEADAPALTRALDHLVDNAVRHASARVGIVVEVGTGDAVLIHVDDDGAGIAEADRARVVARFVRLDEGRARDTGGAGLGLAVASDVATALGGALAITTSPLGGARVTLSLRRSTASPSPSWALAGRAGAERGEHEGEGEQLACESEPET